MSTSPFWCWYFVWLGPLQVLCILLWFLWVHKCSRPVLPGRNCFTGVTSYFLQSFCLVFCIDPWTWRGATVLVFVCFHCCCYCCCYFMFVKDNKIKWEREGKNEEGKEERILKVERIGRWRVSGSSSRRRKA